MLDPVVLDALGEAAAERRPRDKASREQDLFERRSRGRWSFLAWSFFLAHAASAEAAPPGSDALTADEEPEFSETPEAAPAPEIAAQQPLGSPAGRSEDEAGPDSQTSAHDAPELGKLAEVVGAESSSSENSVAGFDTDASATRATRAGVGGGPASPAQPDAAPGVMIDAPLSELVDAGINVGLEDGVEVALNMTEGGVLDAGLDVSAGSGAADATLEVAGGLVHLVRTVEVAVSGMLSADAVVDGIVTTASILKPPLLDGASELVSGLSDQLTTDVLAAAQGGGTSGMMEVLAATGLTDVGLLLSDLGDGLEPVLEPETVVSDWLGIGGSTPLELLSDSGIEGGALDSAALGLLGEDLGLQLPLLENIQLVADSRGAVAAPLQSVVEDITGITSDMLQDASGTIEAIAPTGSGAIQLADPAGDAASTAFDLFSGGSYTEYGITLQSEAPAPVESGPDEDSGDPALFDTIANVLGTTEDTIALKPDEL